MKTGYAMAVAQQRARKAALRILNDITFRAGAHNSAYSFAYTARVRVKGLVHQQLKLFSPECLTIHVGGKSSRQRSLTLRCTNEQLFMLTLRLAEIGDADK